MVIMVRGAERPVHVFRADASFIVCPISVNANTVGGEDEIVWAWFFGKMEGARGDNVKEKQMGKELTELTSVL